MPDEIRDEHLALQWWRFSPNQLTGVPYDDSAAALAELCPRIEAGLEPYDPGFVEIPKPEAAKPRRRFF